MAYDIPTRFPKVWSRHLREKGRTKLGGKWNNKNNNNNSDCHCKAIADITPPHYFGTSVSMVPPFWIFQHAKSFHTLRWIFLRCFMKFDDRNLKFCLNPPFFYFHGNCGKVCPTDANLLAYLVPLDVDVTGNITAKLCVVWSEFNIFCTLVTMAEAAILNLFNPLPPSQKLPHTTVDIPTKFLEVWWKESNIF